MPRTTKSMSSQDSAQTLQGSYNDVDASLSINGYLIAKVGRKVELEIDAETEVYTFSESGVTLYELTLVYTNSDRTDLVSAERTA